MKKFSIISIIIGALLIISGTILLPWIATLLTPPNTASIGIIGGADGPTAILVTSTLWINSIYGRLTVLGVIALIIGVILLIISKNKKN